MKKTTMLLLVCLYIGNTLFAQNPTATLSKKITARAKLAKKGPDDRLLCDPNFIYTGSTSTTGVFDFRIENPVPGYFYNWSFGDGGTATGESATHSYAGTGSYTVSMESYNPQFFDTCRESVTICVSDPSECTANFTWTGYTSAPGIYDFAIMDPDAAIIYTWNFGNGKTATGNETTFTYYTAGSYNVCLVAYNEETKDSCSRCINLCVNQVPFCWANYSINPVDNYHTFTFKAESSDGLAVAGYYWDFGDGNTSTEGPEVTYTYSEVGQYTVCLTIVYVNECSGSYCSDLVIKDPSTIDELRNAMALVEKESPRITGSGNAKTIRVSPNPVTGNRIILSINAAGAGSYRYTVYNSMGVPLLNGTKNLAEGVQQVELDGSRLRAGNYWIEFTSNKQQVRTGFVKL